MHSHPNARLTPISRERLIRRHLNEGVPDVTPFIGPGLMRVGGHGHAAAPC
ncbi:protein of unknown function [Cyanobium sp. NIES-981]|nr:protein of unknown function [Cyanobium sp. NIES-981]